MNRRQFLQASGLALTGASLPFVAMAAPSAINPLQQTKIDFDSAFLKNPNLIGFAGTQTDFPTQQLTLEGRLPKDLTGSFYRNGPGLHARDDQRYTHLFEGDGMVQKFTLSDGKISHTGKFIHTPKFIDEKKAGRFLYSSPEVSLKNSKPIASPDTVNTANTNLLDVQGELWALWEAGSPVAIDKTTLQTKGLVQLGKGSQYEKSLQGMPFSAHPRVEANGDIWNIGLSATGGVVVYHLNATGKVKNLGLIDTKFQGRMLHDFLITAKHIVLVLPSLTRDDSIEGIFSSIQFDKKQPMEVLLVNKQDLTVKKRYQLDAGFVFHFGNAWEDKQGTVRFDACLHPSAKVLHQFSDLMSGKLPENEPSPSVIFQLNPDGSHQKQTMMSDNTEFPVIDPQQTGLRNRYVYTVGSTGSDAFWFDRVRRLDVESGEIAEYRYGRDYLVEEHVFVNPSNKPSKGYLIGTALHVPSQRTCLTIFAENKVSDGPICRAWLPYHLPLGFHGTFV